METASTSVFRAYEEGQFVDIARELSNTFPDLDLRFNLQEGTNTVRCFVADQEADPIELYLGLLQTEELVHQAIFSIKALLHRFDA